MDAEVTTAEGFLLKVGFLVKVKNYEHYFYIVRVEEDRIRVEEDYCGGYRMWVRLDDVEEVISPRSFDKENIEV